MGRLKRSALSCVVSAVLAAALHGAPPPQQFVLEQGAFHGAMETPAATKLAISGDFTFEGWVYAEGDSPNSVLLGRAHGDGCPQPDVAIFICASRLVQFGQSAGAAQAVTPGVAIPLRAWTHVAGVRQGTSLRLFINGVQRASVSASAAATPSLSGPFLVASAIQGAVRQLRVWNRALSAPEIATMSSSRTTADEAGLVAAWPFDEGSGLVIHDRAADPADLAIVRRRYFETTPRWSHTAVLEAGPYFELGPSVSVAPFCFQDGNGPCMSAPSVVDLGADGLPDVISRGSIGNGTGIPAKPFVFRNEGDTHFTNVTSTAFTSDVPDEGGSSAVVADFNGDGRDDLFLSASGLDRPPFPGAQSRLLLQTADGHMQDVTATNLPQVNEFTDASAGVADFDGDGDLDLFVPALFHPAIYLNDGAGRFSISSDALPEDVRGEPFTAVAAMDLRGIGAADLVLGFMQQQNRDRDIVLLNDGHGHFTHGDASAMPLRQTGPDGFSAQMQHADFDGDGWEDIAEFQANSTFTDYRIVLLRNNGNGTFSDISNYVEQTFAPDEVYAHLRLADFNGDGAPDLLAEEPGPALIRLFLNAGRGTFVDASEAIPADLEAMPLAAAAFFMRSGRSDIFAIQGQWYRFLRNIKPIDASLFKARRRRSVRRP